MHSQLSSWTSDARRGRHVKWMKRLTVQTQWKHDTKKEHSRGESSKCVCLCTGKRMGLTFSLISFEKKRERENEPYWKRLCEMGERIQKMPSSLWTVFFEIFFHSFVHWLPQPCIACVCLSLFFSCVTYNLAGPPGGSGEASTVSGHSSRQSSVILRERES